MKFQKLTRDKEKDTVIMAGHVKFSVEQLEDEIKADSEIGRKLKQIEDKLKEY